MTTELKQKLFDYFNNELDTYLTDIELNEIEKIIDASQQTQGEICAVATNWTIKRHLSDLRKVMNADECRFIGSLDECVEFIKENFISHSYQP